MSKHIPILFSTAMVQAIIKERKSQTRRVIKGIALDFVADPENSICPYGQPCDVLWVRETFAPPLPSQHDDHFMYAADFLKKVKGIWKPSIFMPKKACRIWLEVVSVRAERIQDISDSDAIAEGIEGQNNLFKNYNKKYPVEDFIGGGTAALRSFQTLWQTIHEGQDSDWNNNPWVWVVEFKQIEKPENFA